MKRTALLLLTLMAFACSSAPDGPTDDDHVRAAADSCYAHLIAGRVDSFVLRTHGADSLPAAYRQQLADLMRQFLAEQHKKHGGIARAHAVGDTIQGTRANVRLMLTYGDSTQEYVSLPMVKEGGRWMME